MILITTSEKHVNFGRRFNCENCPIALTIREHLKPGMRVFVNTRQVTIYNPIDNCVRYINLPIEVQQFIVDFDWAHLTPPTPPKPFELDIPQEFLKEFVDV